MLINDKKLQSARDVIKLTMQKMIDPKTDWKDTIFISDIETLYEALANAYVDLGGNDLCDCGGTGCIDCNHTGFIPDVDPKDFIGKAYTPELGRRMIYGAVVNSKGIITKVMRKLDFPELTAEKTHLELKFDETPTSIMHKTQVEMLKPYDICYGGDCENCHGRQRCFSGRVYPEDWFAPENAMAFECWKPSKMVFDHGLKFEVDECDSRYEYYKSLGVLDDTSIKAALCRHSDGCPLSE